MTIPTNLIERALNLTGTPMSKMENTHNEYQFFFEPRFFFAYLLSPEFIEKYKNTIEDAWYDTTIFLMFGEAICEFQAGNEELLVDLLTKIPGKTTQI